MEEIRLVHLNELDSVMEIINDAKELLKKDSLQWQQGYPNSLTLKNDILNEDCFGFYRDNYLLGIIVLVKGFNPDYEKIDGKWMHITGDSDMTIHRIAVRSGHHKEKIGDKLIKYSIKYAKENNLKSIKTDTYIKNIPMQKLALNNGFIYKGIIYLVRPEIDNSRLAYELVL